MKGTAMSYFVIIIGLLVITVFLFAMDFLSDQIVIIIPNSPAVESLNSSINYTTVATNVTSIWGILLNLMPFAFFVIGGLLIWFLNSEIKSSPLILIVTLLIALPLLISTAYISNMYESITSTGFFSDKADEFPAITFIFDHLVEIIFGFLIIVGYLIHRNKEGGQI